MATMPAVTGGGVTAAVGGSAGGRRRGVGSLMGRAKAAVAAVH